MPEANPMPVQGKALAVKMSLAVVETDTFCPRNTDAGWARRSAKDREEALPLCNQEQRFGD